MWYLKVLILQDYHLDPSIVKGIVISTPCSKINFIWSFLEYHLLLDVSGMYTSNPKIVRQARPINYMSYEEALEFSHFGAKVIYPPTIQPSNTNYLTLLDKFLVFWKRCFTLIKSMNVFKEILNFSLEEKTNINFPLLDLVLKDLNIISSQIHRLPKHRFHEFTLKEPHKPRFVAGSIGPTNRTQFGVWIG